jgi:beta-glucosidase
VARRAARRVLLLAPLAVLAAAAPAAAATPCGDHPWCDPARPVEERVGLLLAAMTQQEKHELMGAFPDPEANSFNEAIPRLGVPAVRFTDGPAGIRTGAPGAQQGDNPEARTTRMPAPIALAASFDVELAREYAATVADESRRKGRAVLLGPTMNLLRTPLNGRTFESFGEDPHLLARMAVAYVQGVQSQRVVATAKHFAANNQEGVGFVPGAGGSVGSRQVTNAVVDARTLHEMYLPHFEAAVREAGAGSVMLAYNRVNGQYMTENGPLVEGVLKGEWRFDGMAVSDYSATRSTVAAANNGLDLELPQTIFYRPELLAAATAASQISPAEIDEHVRRILRTMFRFGMFEDGELPDDVEIDQRGHGEVARRVAEAGSVLLRNEERRLPLDARSLRRVAIIGPYAERNQGGGGSAEVAPYFSVTPREAIQRRLGEGVEVRFDDGTDLAAAEAAAEGADVALVFVADAQDEAGDKPCLSLQCPSNPSETRVQDPLVERVAAANPNTVVVLQAGGPVLLPWAERVDAILQSWFPGQLGGEAIASLLFGDVKPSGKLPATFPVREADGPITRPEQYPGVGENASYSEGVFVGYRHFDERDIAPRYPFGFGLSYTSFTLDDLRVKRRGGDARVEVSAAVRNTGRRAGAEVPQLYVGMPDPRPGVEQPPRQLKGFAKVRLAPDESRRVTFALDERAFSYWDTRAGDWAIAPGCYELAVGTSSRSTPLRARLPLAGGRCTSARPDPAAKRRPCASRRNFRIRLPRGLRSARVTVAGRRVAVRRRGGRLTARVDLRGSRAKVVRVRVVGRTRGGRVVRQARRYRLCVGRAASALSALSSAGSAAAAPADDARALVARMTQDEKLDLVSGGGFDQRTGYAGAAGTAGVPRLGLPALRFTDGPHGVSGGTDGVTAFPVAMALASTFDPALARRYGAAVAEESLAKGRNILAAPTINMAWSPLWGRLPETFGEDPWLTGTLGAASIRGIQSRGVIAQVKHYVGNDQETGRFGKPVPGAATDFRVGPAAFEDVYNEPFRMAIRDGGVTSVMCSYNRIDAVPACENGAVLARLQREGFTGFVGPDAVAAVRDIAAAARAGTDQFMLGSVPSGLAGTGIRPFVEAALRDGALTQERLDEMATRVVTAMLAVGVAPLREPQARVSTAANVALAADVAARGTVLLQNRRSALPLRRERIRRLAVIGYDAGDGTQANEYGSSSVRGGPPVTPLAELRRRLPGRIAYEPGTRGVVLLPEFDPAALRTRPGGRRGMTATLYATGDHSGAPIKTRIDPRPGFDLQQALEGARSVRWTGTFTPRRSGVHRVSLGASGGAALWVDGRRIAHGEAQSLRTSPLLGPAAPNSFHGTVALRAGRPVRLRVDYTSDPAPLIPPFSPELQVGLAEPDGRLRRAARAARRADAAVVFVNDVSGEGMDRTSLRLPGDQDALIRAVAAANRRTIVVLHTAGPVLTPWRDDVEAIVAAWYPGQTTGRAIARVLLGDQDATGRLPITFPAAAGQGPAGRPGEYPLPAGGGRRRDERFIGYRFYRHNRQRPAFPFGHGLSYTRFAVSDLRVRATGAGLRAQVRVRNTGRRRGREVVQLYLASPEDRGNGRLGGVASVELAPGAAATAVVEVPRETLLRADAAGVRRVPAGRWTVRAGRSSGDLPLVRRLSLAPRP